MLPQGNFIRSIYTYTLHYSRMICTLSSSLGGGTSEAEILKILNAPDRRTEGAEEGRTLRLESQVPKVWHHVAIPSPSRRLSAASWAPPSVGSRCPAGVFRASPRSRGCRTQRGSFFCLPSLPPPPAASPSSSAWQGSLLPASHRRLMASRANPLKPGLLQCPLRGWGRRWARPSRGRMEPLGRGRSSTSSARPGWRVGEAGALCVCESGDAAHRLPGKGPPSLPFGGKSSFLPPTKV